MSARAVDPQLVRELQADIAARREAGIRRRRADGLPPLPVTAQREVDEALISRVVADHDSARVEAGRPPLDETAAHGLVDALRARVFGAGSLHQLLEDPNVEDININGSLTVFVTYADGSKAKLPPVCASDDELRRQVQILGEHVGLSERAFDTSNWEITLRLPDGSRLYATQGVATSGVTVSIRKHRVRSWRLKDLVANDTLPQPLADFLAAAARAKKNLMIVGETGAGKTVLLRAIARAVDPTERIITIERSLELGLDEDTDAHPDCLALEARDANAEGVGEVTMRQLVRSTKRMRPDRVIVGEVLGDEVIDMLLAMTQGNNGSLSTIHANSARGTLAAIETYALLAPERMQPAAVHALIRQGLDFIVFIRAENADGQQRRRVESVLEVVAEADESGQVKTNTIFAPDPAGNIVFQVLPACAADLRDAGWDPNPGAGWV